MQAHDEQIESSDTTPLHLRQSIVRFALVGVANTVIDIGIYTTLRKLHVNFFFANLCSTTIALTFSFILNRHYTFQAHGKALKRQIARFFPVTLFGLWALQPIVIDLLTALDKSIHYSNVFPGTSSLAILLPKLGATVISLIWNFVWYRKYVFGD